LAFGSIFSLPARAQNPPRPPVIVIGFVGGFIAHDNVIHGPMQVAAHLRRDYPSGVQVEIFENHRGEAAHREILRVLGANHEGELSPEAKRQARIILFGHSWGASEAVNLARKLESDGIPVLLSIQVDSVAKAFEDDSVIPANVSEAANFYQAQGLVRGRSEIRAADPSRTKIVENQRFDYSSSEVRCVGYPWFAVAFEKSHIQIECDPKVLEQVELLIRSQLPPPSISTSRP
jgi:pimeloyl-ACP methyl ester carboxylesterase